MTFPFPSADFESPLASSAEVCLPLPASRPSSYVLAVDSVSCAEELRLCGGEGRLRRPSDPLAPGPLDIDFVVPLPLSRLGVELPAYASCVPGPSEVFGFLLSGFAPRGVNGLLSAESLFDAAPAPAESGLGGRLDVRAPRGGCGNELMLIVFRIVLPCEFVPAGIVLSFGSVLGKARPVSGGPPDGDRRPVLGRGIVRSFESVNVGMAPVLFLVFVVGMAGKAEVGGP